MNFVVRAGHRVKLKEKYLDLAKGIEKAMEHESDDYTHCNWYSRYSHQRIGTKTRGLRNERMTKAYPNNG